MNRILKNLCCILVIISATLLTQNLKAQCHIDDWTALQALVKSTGESILLDWGNVPYSYFGSNLTSPPANCDLSPYFPLDDSGRVIELTVAGGITAGFIPPELSKLTNLKKLVLNSWPSYTLIGTIPGELGDLENLEYLDLLENGLEGCFDENLSKLCIQLETARFYQEGGLTANNFEASWEDFCASGKGTCKDFEVIESKPDIETEEGDVFIKDSLHGVILKSESGLCYRVSVKDDGTLVTNKVSCP